MKKAIVLFAAVCMVIGMTACSSEPQSSTSSSSTSSESSASKAESSSSEASVESTADANEGSGTLGDYEIAILSARLGKDYEDKPALIVKYSFKNNAQENKAFLTSTMTKAFQEGVQLETAIIMDDDSYNAEDAMKELQPGASIECEGAFVLTSETSSVEINVQEFSFTSDSVLKKTFDLSTLS